MPQKGSEQESAMENKNMIDTFGAFKKNFKLLQAYRKGTSIVQRTFFL